MNRFIAFDGHAGEEKSLQIDLLAKSLRMNGCSVTVTNESTETELGVRLTELISCGVLDDEAQLAMIRAMRAHHVRSVIDPALQKGGWVIADRFSGSAAALRSECASGKQPHITPDVTFYIHLPPAAVLARTCEDESRAVKGLLEIQRVQDEYEQHARESMGRFVIIDGSKADEVVFAAIQDHIHEAHPARPQVILFNQKDFKRLEDDAKIQTEYGLRIGSVVQRMNETGGRFRDLAVLPAGHEAIVDEFEDLFPNFREYAAYVRRRFALTHLGDRRLAVPPVLFLGEPGIGKTEAVLWLADRFGNGHKVLDMASAQSSAAVVGSDAFWSNAKEGAVFEMLAYKQFANPTIVLEEIDKVDSEAKYNPLGPFYTLLEQRTAAEFSDLSIRNFEIDASHIQWIATANDKYKLPDAILKRFTVFDIPKPSPDQAVKIAKNIYRRALSESSWGSYFSPELSDPVTKKLREKCWGPREMVKAITDALGSAAENRRRVLSVEDFSFATENRQAMGFLEHKNVSTLSGPPLRRGPMPT